MSSAPPAPKLIDVCLSDTEMESLKQYANRHGLTVEQAAEQAVSQALQARYVTNKRINNIVRFPK
jgi:predicted RNase H-like nuclease (RuvC/YqgF family)